MPARGLGERRAPAAEVEVERAGAPGLTPVGALARLEQRRRRRLPAAAAKMRHHELV